jgi:hypothetical protein
MVTLVTNQRKGCRLQEKRRFVAEPYNKKVVTERRTTSNCGWVEVVETTPQLQMWVELSRERSR